MLILVQKVGQTQTLDLRLDLTRRVAQSPQVVRLVWMQAVTVPPHCKSRRIMIVFPFHSMLVHLSARRCADCSLRILQATLMLIKWRLYPGLTIQT